MHTPLRRHAFTVIGLGLSLAALNGCAHVQVDADGQRHVRGLVWLTLPPADVAPGTPGAQGLRLRGLGLVMTQHPGGSALVLGYSDSTVLTLANDAAVRWPPAPASAAPAAPTP